MLSTVQLLHLNLKLRLSHNCQSIFGGQWCMMHWLLLYYISVSTVGAIECTSPRIVMTSAHCAVQSNNDSLLQPPRTGQTPKPYPLGPNFNHVFGDMNAYSVPNISQIPGVVLEQSRSKVDKKVPMSSQIFIWVTQILIVFMFWYDSIL